MIARILPPSEWPRIAETECRVDQRWAAVAERGYVVVVEVGAQIIATAFVFVAGTPQPMIDGLWIAAPYRRRLGVQRKLYRALTWALRALVGPHAPAVRAALMGKAA
jgi:hypothetical protein